jgi:hypothetical protein
MLDVLDHDAADGLVGAVHHRDATNASLPHVPERLEGRLVLANLQQIMLLGADRDR